MSARSTVSPPSPLSKIPIGRVGTLGIGPTLSGRAPRRGRRRSATAAPIPRRRRAHHEQDVEPTLVGLAERACRARGRSRRRRRASPSCHAPLQLGRPDRPARDGPTRAPVGEPGAQPRRELVARGDLDARPRASSATRACPAPRSRRPVTGSATGRPSTSSTLLARDAAEAQDRRVVAAARAVDDRRLHARRAHGTAVEHDVDVVAEIGAHVRGGRRAHPPEPVGRRRGDAPAERPASKRERDRVGGHPQPAPCRGRRSPRRARRAVAAHDDGERTGPERGRERAGVVGHVAAHASSCVGRREVHDHRMVGGPALHRVETAHCVGVAARRHRARRPSRSGTRRARRRGTRAAPSIAASLVMTGRVTSS